VVIYAYIFDIFGNFHFCYFLYTSKTRILYQIPSCGKLHHSPDIENLRLLAAVGRFPR
jgi:hypothetical protein